MLPFREPVTGPSDRPVMLGGKRPVPDPEGFPPAVGGGPPVFCAHTTWEGMGIPIASPAQFRISIPVRMGAPPFVSHIIHGASAKRTPLQSAAELFLLGRLWAMVAQAEACPGQARRA